MRFLLIVVAVVIFSSCVRNKSGQVIQNYQPVESEKVFEVIDVVHANAYSYLKVKENFAEKWVAVTKQDIKPGEVYYYDNALQMNDFKSKDLDRTFEVVYFVNKISKTPPGQNAPGGIASSGHQGKINAGNAEVDMEKSGDELTLAVIFENSAKYAMEIFEIKGTVVKVTPQVMGKNWVHIQDGSDFNGKFDLTITTNSDLNVGDEAIFKGKLSLNKDFGYGYSYDVLMEDAELVSKKTANQQL